MSFSIPSLLAQDTLLPGKQVAIYFSKKNFEFDDSYLIPLSQFLKAAGEPDDGIEDIKLQTLIKLGSMLPDQIKSVTKADSVFFLNESPELATKFIRNYAPERFALTPLDSSFRDLDYIMIFNPFSIGSYKTSSVYVRSNRIYTDQIMIKTGKIRMDIYEPETGIRVASVESCYDGKESNIKKTDFDIFANTSPSGSFLSKFFTKLFADFKAGNQSDCVEN